MKISLFGPALVLLLAAGTGPVLAQTPAADSLRRSGELVGSRPGQTAPRTSPGAAATRRTRAGDPVVSAFLNETVEVAHLHADQLPDIYGRFIDRCRDERRQWSPTQWEAAADVLARLNARYEQVRPGIPLEERLRIRSWQAEFQTLRGARRVKTRLDQ